MSRTRTAAPLVVALVALFTFGGLAPASASSDSYERDVVSKTNNFRNNAGLADVHTKTCVDHYAEVWASRMAATRNLKHQSLSRILKACHLSSVSENIAYGYTSGKSVVRAWMKSPGHRRNIMSSGVRQIGVGAVKDSHGVWWVSQVFGKAA